MVLKKIFDFPYEDTAGVTLFLEHECPELQRFVQLEYLCKKYNIDSETMKSAVRALIEHRRLERKDRVVRRRVGPFNFTGTRPVYRRCR